MNQPQPQLQPLSTKMLLKLPVALKDTLDHEAASRKISTSMLVKLACCAYLGLSENQAKSRVPKSRPQIRKEENTRRKNARHLLTHLAKHDPDKLIALMQQKEVST